MRGDGESLLGHVLGKVQFHHAGINDFGEEIGCQRKGLVICCLRLRIGCLYQRHQTLEQACLPLIRLFDGHFLHEYFAQLSPVFTQIGEIVHEAATEQRGVQHCRQIRKRLVLCGENEGFVIDEKMLCRVQIERQVLCHVRVDDLGFLKQIQVSVIRIVVKF